MLSPLVSKPSKQSAAPTKLNNASSRKSQHCRPTFTSIRHARLRQKSATKHTRQVANCTQSLPRKNQTSLIQKITKTTSATCPEKLKTLQNQFLSPEGRCTRSPRRSA